MIYRFHLNNILEEIEMNLDIILFFVFIVLFSVMLTNHFKFLFAFHRKIQNMTRSVPFGWSKKQFWKWLRQEPYRRTIRRCIMDISYSVVVGGLGGWSLITALITNNMFYLVFTLPMVVHLVLLKRSSQKSKRKLQEFMKVSEKDLRKFIGGK